MITPLSLLQQQLKGPRREIDFANQAKYFLQGAVCGFKNPAGKNSFCKSVKKIYFTAYCVGAGRDRIGEDLLQDKV